MSQTTEGVVSPVTRSPADVGIPGAVNGTKKPLKTQGALPGHLAILSDLVTLKSHDGCSPVSFVTAFHAGRRRADGRRHMPAAPILFQRAF
jgi:hypothetical protein